MTDGIQILYSKYDQCRTPGMEHVRTTVRTVGILAEDAKLIPFYIGWSTKTEHDLALITMKDRPPKCLKCDALGHVRKDCEATKCTNCGNMGHDSEHCTTAKPWSRVLVPAEPENYFEEGLVAEDEDNEAQDSGATITVGNPSKNNVVSSAGATSMDCSAVPQVTLSGEDAIQVAGPTTVVSHDETGVHGLVKTEAVTIPDPITPLCTEDEAEADVEFSDAPELDVSVGHQDLHQSFDSKASSIYRSGDENAVDEDSDYIPGAVLTPIKAGNKRLTRDSPDESSPVANSHAHTKNAKREKKKARKTVARPLAISGKQK